MTEPGGRSRVVARNLLPLAFLYLLALAVRLVFAFNLPFPGLDDPPFYLTVARNLAEGRGLVIDAIWTYSVPHESVTHPSNELWMPLPSLLLAPFLALFGPHLAIGQVLGGIVGALLAPLTWVFARTGFPASHSAGFFAAVMVALSPLLAYQSVSVDSAASFSVLAASAMLLTVAAARKAGQSRSEAPAHRGPSAIGALAGLVEWTGSNRLFLGAGVLAGLAYLARTEGALLALTLAVIARRPIILLGAAAIATPWLIRNLLTFASPSPVPAATLALLPDYAALFQYASAIVPGGLAHQAGLRGEALVHSMALVLVQALFPIAPLAIAGAIIARRAPALRAGLACFLVVLLGTTLLFPVPAIHGTFYHALGAFIPLLSILAVLGLDRLSNNLGGQLFSDSDFMQLLFRAAAVLLLLVQLLLAMEATSEQHRAWAEQFGTAAAWLREHQENGPVMTNEPHTLLYATGVPSIMLPWGSPPEAARAAAARYGVRHLVGFGRFGSYPDALRSAPGFTNVFDQGGVWVFQVTH